MYHADVSINKNKLLYKTWSNKLRLYLKQHGAKMTGDLLSYIEKQSDPVTLASLAALEGYTDEHLEFNSFMYSVLATKTTDGPYLLVNNVEEGHGIEAWRVLSQEFDPKTLLSSQAIMRKFLSIKPAGRIQEISMKLQEFDPAISLRFLGSFQQV